MRRTWVRSSTVCIGLGLLAGISGCGGDDADTEPTEGSMQTCLADSILGCTCEGGARGTQVCDSAGQLGQCVCDPSGLATGTTAGDGGVSTGGSTGGLTAGSTMGTMGSPWPASGSTGAGAATTGSTATTTGSTMATTGTTGMPMPEAGMPEDDAGMPPAAGEGDDIPDNAYCADAVDWDPMWAQWEQEVLMLTNEVRAAGANCDTMGEFGPTTPLTMQPNLRCSARLHSKDMVVQDYFEHTGLDGRSPFDRMSDAGYSGGLMGENIAWGQRSPQEVVDGWVDSDGHCANIMNPGFSELGVGYYYEAGTNAWNATHMWTQNFGAPGFGGGRFPGF